MNVQQALATAQARGLERLDATLLLAHRLQRRREWLIANPDQEIDAKAFAAFDDDCRLRADGVPLAYLTGRREFMGLDLRITPDVLVPRPETETLAQWAIERVQAMSCARPRVIDLGAGSGALALAIANACPRAEVTATDSSAAALAVARTNARRLGLTVRFLLGDWWSAVGSGQFDLAVSNPPYVAAGDPYLTALRHEPQAALVAGARGLDALKRVIGQAQPHLHGWLLVEHGYDQVDDVRHLLAGAGLVGIETRRDLAGHTRCSGGQTPPTRACA
ncbi:MAG TPA: peptide chain release factor N(5)-glutamine methyltransferase [Burkholderiaceae bacterium]|nr:peptide chain release factor N(5)-glutamine methyltransferase [Burkholderiaceae bacterium]